jgi:hypothetical protein
MKRCNENKKSILFCIGFLFLSNFFYAQDIKAVDILIKEKKFAEAKQGIDNLIASTDTSVQYYLLQAHVYNAIANNPSARYLMADGRQVAFNALQQACSLNTTYARYLLAIEKFNLPNEIYKSYIDEGVLLYNAGAERNDKESYITALHNFKKATAINSLMQQYGWGGLVFDTTAIYYIAKSAISAENEIDAVINCKKIADNNIRAFNNFYSLESLYQWLVYYYKSKHEVELFKLYNDKAMRLFPSSVYFKLIAIDRHRQAKDYGKILMLYAELFGLQPDNAAYRLAYYNDVYNYIYSGSMPSQDRFKYENNLINGLKKYNLGSNAGKLLLAKTYINQAQDILQSNQPTKANTKKYRQLLLNSNIYLKQIKNGIGKEGVYYKEALELLITNLSMLGQKSQTRQYQNMLQNM